MKKTYGRECPKNLSSLNTKFRSSHRRCSVKKGVLGLQLYLKRDSDTGVFLWIAKLVRTPFLQNTSRRLLLKVGTFIINILVKVVGRYLSSSKFSCSQKQSSLKQLSLVVQDVLKNTLQL